VSSEKPVFWQAFHNHKVVLKHSKPKDPDATKVAQNRSGVIFVTLPWTCRCVFIRFVPLQSRVSCPTGNGTSGP
jgi:hypothetical protein